MLRKFYSGIFFIICFGCAVEKELPVQTCALRLTEGYTDRISYWPGDSVKLYLHASRPLDLCRLTIFTVTGDSVFSIASPLPFHAKYPWNSGATEGFNYPLTTAFILPEIKSGVYMIGKKIPFIVKTQSDVDVMVVYPSNTATAYSFSGGKNLYSPGQTQVSFQRPVELQTYSQYCLKWLEKLPDLRIGYVADADLDSFENIKGAKVVMIIGHSEYWTREARTNFDRFVDGGRHALVLSGNTMWWQVRYSPGRTKLICFRKAELDSLGEPDRKTIAWISKSLNYPLLASIGVEFTFGGYGKEKDEGWDGYKIIAQDSPLLDGTKLKNGDIISLPTLEYDGTLLRGFNEQKLPVMDVKSLGFFRGEIIGFDRGFRGGPTTPTFIIFQKASTSGVVVNTSSVEWCGAAGMGGSSGDVIKTITLNAISKLLKNEPVFSADQITSNSPKP